MRCTVANHPPLPGEALLSCRRCERHESINDQSHALRGRASASQIRRYLLIWFVPAILQHGMTKTVDRTQRGEEVVRYVITEGVKLAIAGHKVSLKLPRTQSIFG